MKIDNFLNTYNMSGQVYDLKKPFEARVKDNEVVAKTPQDQALKEQTDAFEAFLVKSVLDISLKNQNSLFGKDASDEIYSSMYNDAMSKALSGGLGFSKLLYDFLKERS
ncbi:rod-binding protein [Campylobacter sp. 2018MI35]|uniref:rod-binding protein n=1 Tax=Campylobacter sp. 2018MI34 TaxID=2800582 RepID=UPI001907C076|nr:rod-binding protein [Campylobacter sp. 2018MI34]MBK1991640.1 rod-binding protein [Campylobacter sp. 2018MI34]